MMRALNVLFAVALAVGSAVLSPAVAAEQVDLLLVLAADVSRSVDDAKYRLQRSGYAAALENPRVQEAIRSGQHRRIAVCFLEWSGVVSQKLVIDWTAVGDEKSAREFGDRLLEAPRSFADRTSISAGIDFAMTQLARAPFESQRRTIDVSGDGTNNSGRDVTTARDDAVNQGVTINGLVILSTSPTPWNPEHTNPPGGLAHYYRNNVVGGPGAFVIVAENFESFGTALVNKLVAEIAQANWSRHAQLR
jgi:Protein of unknown function (DUF1194)